MFIARSEYGELLYTLDTTIYILTYLPDRGIKFDPQTTYPNPISDIPTAPFPPKAASFKSNTPSKPSNSVQQL